MLTGEVIGQASDWIRDNHSANWGTNKFLSNFASNWVSILPFLADIFLRKRVHYHLLCALWQFFHLFHLQVLFVQKQNTDIADRFRREIFFQKGFPSFFHFKMQIRFAAMSHDVASRQKSFDTNFSEIRKSHTLHLNLIQNNFWCFSNVINCQSYCITINFYKIIRIACNLGSYFFK